MRTLITGAGGFVGRALVAALAARAASTDEIVATDIAAPPTPPPGNVRWRTAQLDDPAALSALTATRFDRIVHLATVAGVGSQRFDLGRMTNLVATQNLLEAARSSERPPRFVYSSSVGVFGPPLPNMVDDATLPVPANSYGTHKLVSELLIDDYSRAGLIEGLALRLPGVLARPRGSTTMLSAFLSDVFYAARDGAAFDLPMAPGDGSWAMSLHCVIANLLRALEMPAEELPARRYWTAPAILLRMDALVAALGRAYGPANVARIGFAPNPVTRAMFAQPPLSAEGAVRLGMIGDGDADGLVRNVIAGEPALAPLPN